MMAENKTGRKTEYPANEIFFNRWSPRAMSGEPITDKELFTLFEAARWAPSSYNSQPWRFIYAKKDTPHWEKLFSLLVEFNQQWVKNASALLVIASKDNFEHNETLSRTHSFDAGSAWMSLALQGSLMGLVVHGMSGFDYDKARSSLDMPDGYTVEAMAAIGKPGKKEALPEAMQEMEVPSDRKKVEEFVSEGTFKQNKI